METINIYLIENKSAIWGYDAMSEEEYLDSDKICDENYKISVDGKNVLVEDSQKYLGIKSEPWIEFGDKYNSVSAKLDDMGYITPVGV